ncbi:hypothetical protein CCACVL1_21007 [Corchorus capsularis]|uniref:Import inner membrane translocase subunit n=1 Tax=Corchorus capsularis TaxID=210143 RepID=A0A1R3H8N5_COCAP|nr:hypothetical protein CCACVL1_21007 [Corchorus capsularis]
MWKSSSSSSSRLASAFLKLHCNRHQVNPFASGTPSSSSSSSVSSYASNAFNRLSSTPASSNAGLSQFMLRSAHQTAPLRNFYFASKPYSFSPSGFRFFSTKPSNLGQKLKLNVSLPKTVLNNPAKAVTSTLSRYREAIGLHFDAFFKRNYLFVFGAGGVVLCILVWRIMFGIANTFVGLSEGMAKYGFLALSAAMVSFAGLYVRSRFTINPDKVYRMAMRKLNTAAGILEVMGAPLTGTDLRAYVMSGGGLTLKDFKLKLRSKRCFLIFPIQGSERKGLVSVLVKKNKGQHDIKLLAVDIPMASGPDQRLFLIGDEEEYKVGGGLISELRDPVVKAMAATKEFDDLDQIEEEEDAERELQEAERKHREEIEKLEKGGN